jgi:hypothetical protein
MMENANRREDAKLMHEETRLAQESSRLRIQEVQQLVQLHQMGLIDKDAMAAQYTLIDKRYSALDRKRSCSPSPVASSSRKHPQHSRHASSSSAGQWDPKQGLPVPDSDPSLGFR